MATVGLTSGWGCIRTLKASNITSSQLHRAVTIPGCSSASRTPLWPVCGWGSLRVAFHHGEPSIALDIGSLQLLKRPIAFTAERIHLGTLEGPAEEPWPRRDLRRPTLNSDSCAVELRERESVEVLSVCGPLVAEHADSHCLAQQKRVDVVRPPDYGATPSRGRANL